MNKKRITYFIIILVVLLTSLVFFGMNKNFVSYYTNIKKYVVRNNTRDLKNNNLFITLENAGNDPSFGVENEEGIYDKYRFTKMIYYNGKLVAEKSFKILWSANINELGTSETGRKIVITVPNGFSINFWNNTIIQNLVNSQVVSIKNEDGSISYYLNIDNNAIVNGQMAQETDILQNPKEIYKEFKPGKSYDFKIEYFTDESEEPIKTDVLKFLPQNQDIASWKVDTTLNSIQHTPDITGQDGIINTVSPFSYYSMSYGLLTNGTINSANYLSSDYQAGIMFGKYFYSSTSNPVSETKKGSPPSVITDYTSNGSPINIPNYPGMLPALTVTKTSGYIQKELNISIPLPAYVNDSTTSLRLYDRKDGMNKPIFNGNLNGTTVWFRPDGTNELYRLSPAGGAGNNGLYHITYNKEDEILNIRLAPEYYINNNYYLDEQVSYIDLLSRAGTFYINIFMTADLSKLFTKEILGSLDQNNVGKNNAISGADKVSIKYLDETDVIKNVESEQPLIFNFKANEPKINLIAYLSKNNNFLKKQSFNSISRTITESAALSDVITTNLLSNNYNIGGKYSSYDLGRGQTNIYFEYNYEQAYSPITLRNLFNGVNTIGKAGKTARLNNVYKITITNALTNNTRTIDVNENWKDENGEFSNIVTTEQLDLKNNEYVSQIRVTNKIAMITGNNFADNSVNGFGIFSADYVSKEEVYKNQQLEVLPDKYKAKVHVKYGSDQYPETTMTEEVILTKAINNFVVGNDIVLNTYKNNAVAVNDNESLNSLYYFYIKKFQDTKLYDENNYPIVTVSGDGVMLSDIIALERNASYTGERGEKYFRDSFVPVSYINQDNQEIDLRNYDWSLLKYNLGIEDRKFQFIDGVIPNISINPVGYNFKNVLIDNNDKYAKSINFELRINNIDANNNSRFTLIKIWLAASKIKPGYLNYDNVIGTNGINDLAKDYKVLPGNYYNVDISVDSKEAFIPYESDVAIKNANVNSNHILNNISRNTFRIVYGLKNDKIQITELDHFLNPIDKRWTGTYGNSVGLNQTIEQLTPFYNVPYASSKYSTNDNKNRNKQTALTEVIFEAQYNNVSKTINNFNTGDKTIKALVDRGMFDYNQITFNFSKSNSDLLAITNGFAVSAYGIYTKISEMKITYTTNLNSNVQEKILSNKIITNLVSNNEGYVYYDLRDLIGDNEYFTSLLISLPKEWTEFSNDYVRNGVDIDDANQNNNYRKNNGIPNIRLVRIGNLPKQYPVSKKNIGNYNDDNLGYDKLDVNCELIYTDVFNNEFVSTAVGKSSKLKTQEMFVNSLFITQNLYSNERLLTTDPSTSTYQGGTTIWSNEIYFNYFDSGSIDPERTIKPVIYYKIYKEYIPDLDSIKVRPGSSEKLKLITEYGITARFIENGLSGDDEYGTLILDFSNGPGIFQGNKYGKFIQI